MRPAVKFKSEHVGLEHNAERTNDGGAERVASQDERVPRVLLEDRFELREKWAELGVEQLARGGEDARVRAKGVGPARPVERGQVHVLEARFQVRSDVC